MYIFNQIIKSNKPCIYFLPWCSWWSARALRHARRSSSAPRKCTLVVFDDKFFFQSLINSKTDQVVIRQLWTKSITGIISLCLVLDMFSIKKYRRLKLHTGGTYRSVIREGHSQSFSHLEQTNRIERYQPISST